MKSETVSSFILFSFSPPIHFIICATGSLDIGTPISGTFILSLNNFDSILGESVITLIDPLSLLGVKKMYLRNVTFA